MAKLIPDYDISTIENVPERVVAEALCAQLPKDARIIHSYPWLRKERDLDKHWQGEVIREGEADFVIVDPRFGFMVIEVKGGHMFYDPETRRWGRHGGNHAVKDPFEQASKNLFALEKLIADRSFPGQSLPFLRSRAVVFPNCDYQGTQPHRLRLPRPRNNERSLTRRNEEEANGLGAWWNSPVTVWWNPPNEASSKKSASVASTLTMGHPFSSIRDETG